MSKNQNMRVRTVRVENSPEVNEDKLPKAATKCFICHSPLVIYRRMIEQDGNAVFVKSLSRLEACSRPSCFRYKDEEGLKPEWIVV